MLDRKDPFRTFRVAEDLCVKVEALKRAEGDKGSLNGYIETLIARSVGDGGSLSKIASTQEQILMTLTLIQRAAFQDTNRVLVTGHRPGGRQIGQHDKQRKAG